MKPDLAAFVDGEDRDRAGMDRDVALEASLAVANGSSLDVEDVRAIDDLGSFDAEGVAHKVLSTVEGSMMCGSRPSARASAALIRPRKSGCGRSGRDLNSGWAWVPTKKEWPGSSTNSTSRPSGEFPEQRSPAASNCSR